MSAHSEQSPVPGPIGEAVPITAGLVRRAAEGDASAWDELYRRSFRMVYRRLRYLTGDPDIAEDLTQEVFAQAVPGLARFGERASLDVWLCAIALNLARKHWRKRRRTASAHDRLAIVEELKAPRTQQDVEAFAAARERERVLYSVLAELPESLREAFILRDVEKVAAKEAAELLGTSEDNVWMRASRARAQIRKLLVERGAMGEA